MTLEFPRASEDTPAYLSGSFEWHWTATFEAFTSTFDTGERPLSTPAGEYRFVVNGKRREAGGVAPYRLRSKSFRVRRWDGVEITSASATGSGRVRVNVGPKRTIGVPKAQKSGGKRIASRIGPIDYPDSYSSPVKFVNDKRSVTRDVKRPDDAGLFERFSLCLQLPPVGRHRRGGLRPGHAGGSARAGIDEARAAAPKRARDRRRA